MADLVVPPQRAGAGALPDRAAAVAEVAARHADAVDREARFPTEAVAAMADAGLLQLLVPADVGGTGGDLATAMECVAAVGAADASAGMVLAMHLIQVACLVRHGHTPELRGLLAELGARPFLLASATTEAGVGGDTRTSICAVERVGDRVSLAKDAMVISYGESAYGVLATARASVDAGPGEQVLLACLPPGLGLEPTGGWDVLGFRGTRSLGFRLTASGPAGLVFPDPYALISSHTMLPTAHLLWGALWAAMSGAAVDHAAAFARAAGRSDPARAATDTRLAQLVIRQQGLRALLDDAARRYAAVEHDPAATGAVGFALALNGLKVAASTELPEIVGDALRIVGMAGYREGGPFAMGRLLRDAHGAALMVSNERILRNDAALLLVHKGSW